MKSLLNQLALTVESPKKLDTSPMVIRTTQLHDSTIAPMRAFAKAKAALLRDTKGPQE